MIHGNRELERALTPGPIVRALGPKQIEAVDDILAEVLVGRVRRGELALLVRIGENSRFGGGGRRFRRVVDVDGALVGSRT